MTGPHRRNVLLLLSLVACLQGCVALVAAGGATAIMAANDRRTMGAQLDDQNIEMKIGSAIGSDERLKDVHINATSFNGVVLLTGETSSAEQRDLLLAATRNIRGIRRTVNEIRVAPVAPASNRSRDTWLTSKVKTKLLGIEKLDSSQVKIVTENAVVYLMGLLKREEAELATNAATDVGGIERVVKLFEYLD
ncbi:MAG TPA: BON domain-containing protein [Burkholderiales bacterium]|nr:BON domain-containing protein [Burkholderiales bacterium]